VNLTSARIVLRPRLRLESMDLAFRFVLRDARSTFGVLTLSACAPAFVTVMAIRKHFDWGWLPTWMLAVTLGSFVSGVFTVAASLLLFDERVRPERAARAFLSRLGPYFWAMLLSRSLIVISGALVVTGLVAWARSAFVPEAVLLEQQPASRAIARSARLSRSAGDALGSVIVGALMSLLILFGVEAAYFAVARDLLELPVDPGHLFSDGGSPAALAGYFASVPLVATHRFLSYIDARTRQDGWDVQVQLMALADRGEA
jgi:hypothetical protein